MKTQDVLIAHPTTEKQVNLLTALLKKLNIKFELSKEKPYDPAFVAKIQKARQDYKDGKGKVYTSEQLNALWK